MSYAVIYAVDLEALPAQVQAEAARAFQQVAEAVAGIQPASPFFASMDDSVLLIDIAGWRFGYRIDPRRREVRVIEASPLRLIRK